MVKHLCKYHESFLPRTFHCIQYLATVYIHTFHTSVYIHVCICILSVNQGALKGACIILIIRILIPVRNTKYIITYVKPGKNINTFGSAQCSV